MKPEYLPFYIDGRESKTLRVDADDLIDDIVKRVTDGEPLWATVHTVAEKAGQSFCLDASKRKRFAKEYGEDVKEAGGDEAAAWEAFCAGKVDELAESLEPAALEALMETVEDGDGDGDGEDDEDGDEDEGGEDEE